MSSLDSQTLSLSTLFTRDIVRRYVYKSEMSEKTEVLVGRLFVGGILAVAWLLSLVIERSIFRLGIWSFTGFAALLPLVVAAVYWRRSTRVGALATILTVVVSWVYFVERSWSDPGYSVGGTGLKPVVVMLFLSSLAMALGSLVSRPPGGEVLARFFGDGETERG